MPPLVGNLVWLSGGCSKLALTSWLWSSKHLPGSSEAIFWKTLATKPLKWKSTKQQVPPLVGNLVWLSGGCSKLALTLWLWSPQHLWGPSEAIFLILIKKFEIMYVLKFLPASKMTRKLKKSEKIFFFAGNCTFSTWIWIVHVLSFLLRYITFI